MLNVFSIVGGNVNSYFKSEKAAFYWTIELALQQAGSGDILSAGSGDLSRALPFGGKYDLLSAL